MNIEIKEMTITELDYIKDIFTSDFDDFWNYNILKEELESKNSKYIVAIIDRKIVGFAGIKVMLDEADIMNIVTKKDFRNKGIGNLLLENLITLSRNLNLNTITLEVNEENMPAIRLYEKFGFRNLGVRKNYYKDKNGIIMTKTLNH